MKRIIKEEFPMLIKDVTAKGMDLTKSDLKDTSFRNAFLNNVSFKSEQKK